MYSNLYSLTQSANEVVQSYASQTAEGDQSYSSDRITDEVEFVEEVFAGETDGGKKVGFKESQSEVGL
ncbi:hypothetical protein ACH5RR_021410 [Cinchona calisaya]|uniref:Uncharacterized protein n=1 Tax=Cinchona calisaya TaxID=153742 RepID=A0ABD2ZH84_9GENT